MNLQQKALEYARNHSSAPDKETPEWIITDYLAGAKEILDNPELYGLAHRERYEELSTKEELARDAYISMKGHSIAASKVRCIEYAMEVYAELIIKENKELKEKVTELEGVIAKLSQKVILYESNY